MNAQAALLASPRMTAIWDDCWYSLQGHSRGPLVETMFLSEVIPWETIQSRESIHMIQHQRRRRGYERRGQLDKRPEKGRRSIRHSGHDIAVHEMQDSHCGAEDRLKNGLDLGLDHGRPSLRMRANRLLAGVTLAQ